MDETVRPLRIPPQMNVYADKHNMLHLVQTLVSSLVIDQPEDPISHLISLLRRSCSDSESVHLNAAVTPPGGAMESQPGGAVTQSDYIKSVCLSVCLSVSTQGDAARTSCCR
ncbi:Adenylate kinase 8 [Nibea albiflora]|nr:Adenylate kinase 8 [Nibea albiflora]